MSLRGASRRSDYGRIGDRIRSARQQARLSQARLAAEVGVRPGAVGQWEMAGGTTPSVEHLSQVAIATKVSFEWLATGRGSPRSTATTEPPAASMAAFAHDLVEEQVLESLRALSRPKREAIARMLREFARR